MRHLSTTVLLIEQLLLLEFLHLLLELHIGSLLLFLLGSNSGLGIHLALLLHVGLLLLEHTLFFFKAMLPQHAQLAIRIFLHLDADSIFTRYLLIGYHQVQKRADLLANSIIWTFIQYNAHIAQT